MARYIVEITFHSAHNLPIADFNSLSCDPYIHATIDVPSLARNPDDPPLTFRTPTVRRSRHAEWCPSTSSGTCDCHATPPTSAPEKGAARVDCKASGKWIVGGVPAAGFDLVMHVRDEDPGNTDDKLGKATARFRPGENGGVQLAPGVEVKEKTYPIKKRKASARVYVFTYLAAMMPGVKLDKHGYVVVSMKVLGECKDEAEGAVYTLGPNKWSQHFSPLIGAITPARHARAGKIAQTNGSSTDDNADEPPESSAFVGNKLQLTGPVPPALRHRFVGYRPFIQSMFTDTGVRGRILNVLLHRQYRSVYSYDRHTRYGVIEGPVPGASTSTAGAGAATTDGDDSDAARTHSRALALQFLRMAHFGTGGRLHTYVLTLDGEWRFTETGAEFAVDLLSKHTMHADVAREIAWSGEFFVRRRVDRPGGGFASAVAVEQGAIGQDKSKADGEEGKDGAPEGEPAPDFDADDQSIVEDPAQYELVIDNDSGTYRPKKALLPVLHAWLADPRRLGALGRVTCVDGFDEGLQAAKKARAAMKKRTSGGEAGQGVQPKKKGTLGKVEARVQQAEEKAMETVMKEDAVLMGKGKSKSKSEGDVEGTNNSGAPAQNGTTTSNEGTDKAGPLEAGHGHADVEQNGHMSANGHADEVASPVAQNGHAIV